MRPEGRTFTDFVRPRRFLCVRDAGRTATLFTGCEFDTHLRQIFFPVYFRLSTPLEHVRKVVGGFGKKAVLALVWARKHICVANLHMTVAVNYLLKDKF